MNQETPKIIRNFSLQVNDPLTGYQNVSLSYESQQRCEMVRLQSNSGTYGMMLPETFTALAHAWLVSQGYPVGDPVAITSVAVVQHLPFEEEKEGHC